MLSASDPPPLKSGQRKVAFQNHHDDDKDDHHLPTFSIRDYVFTARQNHIEKNWPFSQHHLLLCSKHEIKDLLPPFEPPDSIRKQCLRKGRHRLVSQFDAKKSIEEFTSLELQRYSGPAPPLLHEQENPTRQSGLSRSPGLDHAVETPVIDDPQSERESPPTHARVPCSVQEESCALSKFPLDLHNTQLLFASKKNKTTIETSGKKCRFILKLGPLSGLAHTEDITSNATTVSDSMASKVCPVCKTFSSTSNTTLNAHIDQCLSVESTSKWVMNDAKVTKQIVKPTKKRSMVDIYMTATRCTLEELDKRNGTNWAATSSLLTAEAKAVADEKRQKLSGAEHEDSSDEYPVYFDSNGTKLRIISKFPSGSISTEGDAPRKHIIDNKKHFRTKNAKEWKAQLRKKKLYSLESNEVGISRVQKMKHKIKKGFHKEDSPSQILKARDQMNYSESGTLKKWVCSKRTGLLKRVGGKDNRVVPGFPSSITLSPLIRRNKMDLGDSSGDSDPFGSAVSSPKTIYVDSSCYESQVTDHGVDSHMTTERKHNQFPNERTSGLRDGCVLKLPKSSGKFASFQKSKRVEVNASPSGNSDSLVKDKESILSRELVAKPSFSNSSSKLNGKCSVLKKPRTHRYIAKMGEQVGARPLNIKDQCYCEHDSTENQPGSYKNGVILNSNGSSDKVRPEVEEIFDQFSFDGVGVLTPRREREATRISEWGKPMITEEAPRSGETIEKLIKAPFQKIHSRNNVTDDIDGLETGAEEVLVNADTVTKTFSSKAVGSPNSRSSFGSKFHSLSTSLDARSTGEHKRCVRGIETMMPVQQKLCASQVTYKGSEVCVIGEDVDREAEADFEYLGQYTRCETGRPFLPAPPGSLLLSLWDSNSEDPKEKSSLALNEMLFIRDKHAVVDTESSESRVSATSTISHPSVLRSDLKFLDTESNAKACAVQDSLILGLSAGSTETIVEDATSSPCCCSWKKKPTYHHPQLPAQMVFNANNTRPAIFNKPNSFPVSRNINMVAPICESRRGCHDDINRGHVFSQVQDVQSTSNPVFRLMGKNLMVANKDDDASVKLGQATRDSPDTCASTKFTNLISFSPRDCVYSASSQDSCNPQPHFLSEDVSKRFASDKSMVAKHNNIDMGEIGCSSMWRGLANLQIQQKKHMSRVDSFPGHLQHRVMDESPESEADGTNGNHPSPVGVLPPNSPWSNPFSSTSPAKWGGASKTSGLTLRNPFTSISSSSACDMSRRTMYHSPSLP